MSFECSNLLMHKSHGVIDTFHVFKAVNPPSPQILRIDREGIIENVKMHMTLFVMTPYDVVCAKIVVDSDRSTNSSYLASCIENEYHKNKKKFSNYPGDFSL